MSSSSGSYRVSSSFGCFIYNIFLSISVALRRVAEGSIIFLFYFIAGDSNVKDLQQFDHFITIIFFFQWHIN